MHDRYGKYYSLTGMEGPGCCFWCGTDVNRGQRYCSKEHQTLYLESFHWPEASAAAFRRAHRKCADCGEKPVLIHHIEPLNGTLRLWNALNRGDNLMALCVSCHGKRHAPEPKWPPRKITPDIYELARSHGQLVFKELL